MTTTFLIGLVVLAVAGLVAFFFLKGVSAAQIDGLFADAHLGIVAGKLLQQGVSVSALLAQYQALKASGLDNEAIADELAKGLTVQSKTDERL